MQSEEVLIDIAEDVAKRIYNNFISGRGGHKEVVMSDRGEEKYLYMDTVDFNGFTTTYRVHRGR